MRFLNILVLLTQLACMNHISIKKKINIPKDISETSGIVYLEKENEIITFNDSGGKPELYILNSKTGKIKRTVKVKKAKNHDWESITKDDDFIYIGDTGNNDGNRKNLMIYKIAIKDVLSKRKVSSKKIRYEYEDQKSFKKVKYKTDFDCESITVYNNQLYIFTKSKGGNKTNVYSIPNTKGDYKAKKVHSLKIDCMLTSVDYNPENKTFIGTAYDEDYSPYLIQFNEKELDSGNFHKIDLYDELGTVNQLEAIAWKNKKSVYVTREASKTTVNGKKYDRKQKLMVISLK